MFLRTLAFLVFACSVCAVETPTPPAITTATSLEQLAAIVGDGSIPVLVKVGAAWCQPCRAMEPEIEAFVEANPGAIRVVLVDVDVAPQLSQALEASALPSLVLYRDGKAESRREGYFSRYQLAVWTSLRAPSAP